MKILRHFTANDEKLDRFDFRRELSMEAYLVENEGILALDEPFIDVNVIAEELTLKQGRSSKDTDGRIDLLVTYAQEYIGVVELKLGQLTEVHLQQLEDYLKTKDGILKEYPNIIPKELAPSPKWVGVLVGNSIEEKLASKIAAGHTTKHGDIPIAALTLQRFRSEKGNVYVVTESYFKDTSSNRDTSKYLFNDRQLGKGRLVLEVVKKFVAKNPDITYPALEKAFPKHCQGSKGVFSTLDEANQIFSNTNQKRHFLKPDEIIQLEDTKIAVSNQWGIGNIDNFIHKAKEHGFKILKE
ncbi:MAG: hypothetical protein ABJO86_14440 [Lentilitoribacter sp.]